MGTKPVGSASTDSPTGDDTPTKVSTMTHPEPATGDPVRPAPHGIGGRLHAKLDRVRSTATGRLALKIGIGVVGALVVGLGIVLIPLPGPGWALVILGLAIWSVEFHWANRLLHFTKRHVQSWTHWVTRQSLPLRLVLGAVSLVFVAAVVWASVRVTFDVDLVAVCRDFITTR
jgi:uncharacterized protein (TIGR02611 family)